MRTTTRTLMSALAALALAGGLAAAGAPGANAAAAPGCPAQKIFELGGAGHGGGEDYDPFNATVPPDVQTEKVVYPAEIAPYPGHRYLLDESVEIGVANLDRAVRGFHAVCGESRITITGYSLGALTAGNELDNLVKGNDIPHRLLDGVLYSDPRRPANPAKGPDGNGDGAAGGVMTNIPTFFPGWTMRGPRPGFGDVPVRSVCNQNDGICNSANPYTNLAAFANGWAGYFGGAHGAYALNPLADAGNGEKFIAQPPIIQYGPPLPIPLPNPYVQFNGNFQASQDAVRTIRDATRAVLPPDVWRQLVAQFPWIEHL